MKRTFAFGAATSQGQWPAQEDGYFVDPASGFFVLADGFGGRGAGDAAAHQALQVWRSRKWQLSAKEGGLYSPAELAQRDALAEIHTKLMQWNEKRPPGSRGGCSLVSAWISLRGELTVAGCGACAAFLVRQGAWIPLLAPQAIPRRMPGDPFLASRALGVGKDLAVESRLLGLEPSDILFLFSGGLPWERDGYFGELSSQLALRMPGADLTEIAGLAAGTAAPAAPWNQSVVVVEYLS